MVQSPFAIQAEKLESYRDKEYALFRNVFSETEIAELRRKAYSVMDEFSAKSKVMLHPKNKKRQARIADGDLLSKPAFAGLVLDTRLITIAQGLLGATPDNPVTYFMDSNYQIGEGAMGFHRDNVDRDDATLPDWQASPYPILRMGIYLQDHDRYSGGLKVRPGSHNYFPLGYSGKAYQISSRAGDVVVWNLRTAHAGNVVKLRFAPSLNLNSSIEKRVPVWLKVPEKQERASLFLTYGLQGPMLERYLKEMFTVRKGFADYMLTSTLDGETQAKIAATPGLRLMDMQPYLMK